MRCWCNCVRVLGAHLFGFCAGDEPHSGSEGGERRSKNLPMMRSISLSGRNLESHFQYAKKGPQGKLVDREGYLQIRMRKTR